MPPRTSLLFGASFTRIDGLSSLNAIALATPDRSGLPKLGGLLVKRRLVPFIEGRHQRAQQWKLARFRDYDVGAMVCYESMYPEPARFAAANGADLLVVVSDDAGMRRAPIAWTHAEQARFRAIENGLPLVRDGQAGVTYAIDAYGRELGRIDAWEVGTLTRDVPLHDVATPYRRIGPHWGWAWAALAFGPAIARRRAQAQREKGASRPSS
jgi:apolipoprotein N-acyltransferase